MSKGTVLPRWQEGLFAVLYVMNSGESSEKRDAHIELASDAANEAWQIFLEVVQTIPLLLPRDIVFICWGFSKYVLDFHCLTKQISTPWVPANGCDFSVFFGVMMALCFLTYAMAAVAYWVASTFHKKDAQFVWPITFLRTTVRIFMNLFFLSVVQTQFSVFCCPHLVTEKVLTGLECGSPMHVVLMIITLSSMLITIPFGILSALLYNTHDTAANNPSSAAHGRCRLLNVIAQLVLAANHATTIASVSYGPGSGNGNMWSADIAQFCAVVALAVHAGGRIVYAPLLVGWANAARTGLAFCFLAMALCGFTRQQGHVIFVTVISMIGFVVGFFFANFRANRMKAWARQRFYSVKPRVNHQHASELIDLLFEESNVETGAQDDALQGRTSQSPSILRLKADSAAFKSILWFESDIEMVFRFFFEDWNDMSQEDQLAAKVAINEIFVQVFHAGVHKGFAQMWYARIAQELFENDLIAKHFLQLVSESDHFIDLKYLAYKMEKDYEAAAATRQASKRKSVADIVTFKPYAEEAKKTHRAALQRLHEVISRMADVDRQLALGDGEDADGTGSIDTELQGRAGRVSDVQKVSLNKMLQQALQTVREADSAYSALCKAFPKSRESSELYAMFKRQVGADDSEEPLQSEREEDSSANDSKSFGSDGPTVGAKTPKQEYMQELRAKLSGIMRFTVLLMWGGLLLMGAMMMVIAGVGNSREQWLVDQTVSNVDNLNSIRTSWLGICKFSVEISHFIGVRDNDRTLLTRQIPAESSQLVNLLASVQNTNINDDNNPQTPPSDLLSHLVWANTGRAVLSDSDLAGHDKDWSHQVSILRAESKSRTVDLLSDSDSLVSSNAIPRVVAVARSPASAVLRKFHTLYKTAKADGGGTWQCRKCNLHDLYVTDARGVLVGLSLESGNRMELSTDMSVFKQVRQLQIGKNLDKVADEFDSDPVLQERYESWDIHALLKYHHERRRFLEFFSTVKRSDPLVSQVYVHRVQHSEHAEEKLITITLPFWSLVAPTDSATDRPIGYLTAEARILTSAFLEQVLKTQDLVWREIMNDLVVLTKRISNSLDEQIADADELKRDAYTGLYVNLTQYSAVSTASQNAADMRTNEAWGRSYSMESFQTVVAKFSNAVITSTSQLQTMTVSELVQMPEYRFVTEMCVQDAQDFSLRLTDLTTEFPKSYIETNVAVLLGITCCVVFVNVLSCAWMNYAIGSRLGDFEKRDRLGLSVAFNLLMDTPYMSKKQMARRFQQHLKIARGLSARFNRVFGSDSRRSLADLSKANLSSSFLSASPMSDPLGSSSRRSLAESTRARVLSDANSNLSPQPSPHTGLSGRLDRETSPPTRHAQETDASYQLRYGSQVITSVTPVQSQNNSPVTRDDNSRDARPNFGGDVDAAPVSDEWDLEKETGDGWLTDSNRSPTGKLKRVSITTDNSFFGQQMSGRHAALSLTCKRPSQNEASREPQFSNMPADGCHTVTEFQFPTINTVGVEAKPRGSLSHSQSSFSGRIVRKKPVEPISFWGRVHKLLFGWVQGYVSRWIVLFWLAMIVYCSGLLARVVMNFESFGGFCEDIALSQRMHYYFRNACTRVMDTVTWERMPWRTDGGQKLREDFDESLANAEESLAELVASREGLKYAPRLSLLFKDTCLLTSGNCGRRVGWEAYDNPELMERGMYRAALVWIDHVRDLRREYADTKHPQTFINSTYPKEFWFVRDSIAYDLAPGLGKLIETYMDQAQDDVAYSSALVWAVACGGLGVVGVIAVMCSLVVRWQRQQIADVLTALRMLSWEDIQCQQVVTVVKTLTETT